MKSTKELQEKKARKEMTAETVGLKKKAQREIDALLKELQAGRLDANTLETGLCELGKIVEAMPKHEHP
jgi:predicted  nucleic acid-binding Zn-ribbon protein